MRAIIFTCIILYTGNTLSMNILKPLTYFLALFAAVKGSAISYTQNQDSLGQYLHPETVRNENDYYLPPLTITRKKGTSLQGYFSKETKLGKMFESIQERQDELRALAEKENPGNIYTDPFNIKVKRRITEDRPIGPYHKTKEGNYCQSVTKYKQEKVEDCSGPAHIIDSQESEDMRKLKAFEKQFYEAQNERWYDASSEFEIPDEIETFNIKNIDFNITPNKPSGPFNEEGNGNFCQKITTIVRKKYNPCDE